MELYNRPANEFVAGFIGSPKMNFIDAAKLGEGQAKTIGVRPEHLTVDATSGAWKGTVIHAEHLGADTNLYIDTEKAGLITVRIFGVYNAEAGRDPLRHAGPAKDLSFRRGRQDAGLNERRSPSHRSAARSRGRRWTKPILPP